MKGSLLGVLGLLFMIFFNVKYFGISQQPSLFNDGHQHGPDRPVPPLFESYLVFGNGMQLFEIIRQGHLRIFLFHEVRVGFLMD